MNVWDEKFYGGTEHLQDKYRIPEENFGDFIKVLKANKAKRILDLGCGTGRHTIALAKAGFEVCGIDISKNALGVCQERLKEAGLKADLKLADIYKPLSYKDNFFDGFISTSTLHHAILKDIKKLVKELERVLKSGAFIMIVVPKKMSSDVKRTDVKTIEPETIIHISGPEQGVPHHRFESADDLIKLFNNFKVIKILLKEKLNFPDSHPHFVMFGRLEK